MNKLFTALNLEQYAQVNQVIDLGEVGIHVPQEQVYILRMLIRKPLALYKLPKEVRWIGNLLRVADSYQNKLNLHQPFCYLTIRSGLRQSTNNDVWHVDGFSMRITHLPEQNYIWCNNHPTEYLEEQFVFPKDFDPNKHNIHSFFQKNAKTEAKVLKPNTLYMIDPYIVHRRPKIDANVHRTFVRISYTPIEIMDDNNTQNPLLPIGPYNRDGIKDFRDTLKNYE